MCFATAALAAGLFGAGISATGAVEQGQATANAAHYSATVAANNALVAQQNAAYAEQAGLAKTAAEGMRARATFGKLKAAQAASGVDVNTGSNADVQASQRELSQLDTETTMSNAELQAYGYRTNATSFQAQAGLENLEAAQAPIGADLSAGGGLLSSSSGLGSKWAQYGSGS